MYPSLNPRTKKVDLKIDDVDGIQALYGSNPHFKLTSSEYENASNMGTGLKSRTSEWTISLLLAAAVFMVLFLGS
uniref:Uncharacterized protein n=1 Tax=Rhizophora mucronata TaxID=61149 RepID=A0A2P2J9V7_RHIMU